LKVVVWTASHWWCGVNVSEKKNKDEEAKKQRSKENNWRKVIL
jgi:L,D-peptidoglycan transpeptidase YkuD (ErfK/YbiS/YcfS/YnhG family)